MKDKYPFIKFVRIFYDRIVKIYRIIIGLLILMFLGGIIVSRVEGIDLIESIYFSFITGFTIGYGDIVPHTKIGRLVSVSIGFIGIIFTGIMVGLSTSAMMEFFKKE